MSKDNSKKEYLEAKPEEKKKKVKEQLLFDAGDTLAEKHKKNREYQRNKLNE